MSLKNLKLRGNKANRPIDPLEVFNSSTLRGSVENLWTPQSDALKKWFECRDRKEIIIEMATGGGKTLVGLLAAQAMTNECQDKVLYLCPTNQLVRQTADKALAIGLSPAIYSSNTWENRDAFMRNEVPCITSYAAAFNACSTFIRESVKAIVLDDAHVAVPQLRSQFTLRVPKSHPAFREIVDLLRPYFAKVGKSYRLNEVLSDDPLAILLVPAHVFAPITSIVETILRKHKIHKK